MFSFFTAAVMPFNSGLHRIVAVPQLKQATAVMPCNFGFRRFVALRLA
jgi:hypothetical protein